MAINFSYLSKNVLKSVFTLLCTAHRFPNSWASKQTKATFTRWYKMTRSNANVQHVTDGSLFIIRFYNDTTHPKIINTNGSISYLYLVFMDFSWAKLGLNLDV